MEDPLKQLPEILNHGRLKKVTFKEDHRQKVLQKARNLHKPPAPKSWLYHWFHQSLSLALGVAFIFLFIQFAQDNTAKDLEVMNAEQAIKIPYANQAILTKAKHDMRNHHDVSSVVADQHGDTLSVYIIFPEGLSTKGQFSLTESYLKEVSHLTLNEPYASQNYLGELWKYVNVKVYITDLKSSDNQMLASRLDAEFGYDWLGTINTKIGKLMWEPLLKDDKAVERGIYNNK